MHKCIHINTHRYMYLHWLGEEKYSVYSLLTSSQISVLYKYVSIFKYMYMYVYSLYVYFHWLGEEKD
jgi:hypothetical protein